MRVFLLSGLLWIASQSFAQKNDVKEEVPPALGVDNLTLLVQDEDKNQLSKTISEMFEKHYKGPYEIQPASVIQSKKYLDATKYRFVFVVLTKQNPGQWIGRERFPPTTDYAYAVLDRRLGIQYRLDGWAGGFKRSMADYVKEMGKVRASNAK
ncbi:MAG: hypothetical protein ACKO6Q_05105 [Bacteroidota bacterium]